MTSAGSVPAVWDPFTDAMQARGSPFIEWNRLKGQDWGAVEGLFSDTKSPIFLEEAKKVQQSLDW